MELKPQKVFFFLYKYVKYIETHLYINHILTGASSALQEHQCDYGRCSHSTWVQTEGGGRGQSPYSERHSQKYFVSGCRTVKTE